MKQRKRDKVQITLAILQTLRDESKDEKLSLTKVAHLVNLPYDRFLKYLDHLVRLHMVGCDIQGGKKKIFVTEKGLKFIDECVKFNEFLRKMGLLP